MDYSELKAYEPLLARRGWAALLDYLAYFGLFYSYLVFFGHYDWTGALVVTGFGNLFMICLMWFIYFPFCEGVFGYTLFKAILNLKVKPDNRSDYRLMVAIKRHLLDPIDFGLFGVIAAVSARSRDDHKRLGDIFAHSTVVRYIGEEEHHLPSIIERKDANGA